MTLTIHRWTTRGLGSVNTYWIETERAVIVIDGQRELSKARQARMEIERSGKPIEAVFLTHPHPDHFGGLGVFAPQGSGIPVYGSARTRDSIAGDRFGLVQASRELLKDDFPERVTLPDHIVEDGNELTVAGVVIRVGELGEGEAECMTALHFPEERTLFCADAVQNGMTAFLLEGRSGAWLAQLDRLSSRFPDIGLLYPGHGEAGALDELVARQAEYLRTFRDLIDAEIAEGRLADGADGRIAAAMNDRYPGYEPVAAIRNLLLMNVGPIAKELAAGPGERKTSS